MALHIIINHNISYNYIALILYNNISVAPGSRVIIVFIVQYAITDKIHIILSLCNNYYFPPRDRYGRPSYYALMRMVPVVPCKYIIKLIRIIKTNTSCID